MNKALQAKIIKRTMTKFLKISGGFLCFFLFSSSTSGAFAAAVTESSLDLDSCIKLALEQNRTVMSGREKVKKARAQIDETKASAYPELKASANYTYLGDTESYGSGVGPTFSIQEDNYRLNMSLEQKLYAPEVFEAIKASKTYSNQAATEFEIVRANVAADVKKAYYRYLYTKEMITVTEESIDRLERHLDDVKSRFGVGLATDFDVLRAEVQLANTIPSLTADRNAFSRAGNMLKSLLGMKTEEELLIYGALEYAPFEISLKEALGTALTKRPEITYLDYYIKNLEHSVQVSRKESLPSLSLNGNYAYANDKIDISGESEWGTSWSMGLALEFTIFDGWGNSSRIAGKKSDVRSARIEKDDQLSSIDLEVRTAYNYLNEVRDLIRSQEKNIEKAGRAFEIAEAGNLNGVVTELELQDAQFALTRAKSNYKQAVYDWLVARTELDRAMGIVMEGI